MARCQCGKLDTPITKERVGDDEEGVHPLTHKGSECRIDVTDGAGVEDVDLQPEGACCASMSPTLDSVRTGSVGLTSTAIRAAPGTSSCRSPNLFATNSAMKKLIPVALPPGCARLATRPSLTGSSPTLKTIGIVVVAALAASDAGGLFGTAITLT